MIHHCWLKSLTLVSFGDKTKVHIVAEVWFSSAVIQETISAGKIIGTVFGEVGRYFEDFPQKEQTVHV